MAMKTKVKVTELVGEKLDPNARYIFGIEESSLSGEQLYEIIATFRGEPATSMKVFQVLKEPEK